MLSRMSEKSREGGGAEEVGNRKESTGSIAVIPLPPFLGVDAPIDPRRAVFMVCDML